MEKLAIEAHASYLIINSYYQKDINNMRLFLIREMAAIRMYRRYQKAFGK